MNSKHKGSAGERELCAYLAAQGITPQAELIRLGLDPAQGLLSVEDVAAWIESHIVQQTARGYQCLGHELSWGLLWGKCAQTPVKSLSKIGQIYSKNILSGD